MASEPTPPGSKHSPMRSARTPVGSARTSVGDESVELKVNHRLLGEHLAALLHGVRNHLGDGFPATGRERAIYQSAAIVALYGNFARALGGLVAARRKR